MSRTDPPLKIRLPQALKDKVKLASETARRSLNSEIIERLERTFAQDEMAGVPDFTASDRLETLEKRVDAILLDPLIDGLAALEARVAKLEKM